MIDVHQNSICFVNFFSECRVGLKLVKTVYTGGGVHYFVFNQSHMHKCYLAFSSHTYTKADGQLD